MNKGYILVTGAALRLGKSIACRLAQDGWSLILHYHKSVKEILSTKIECEKKAIFENQKFISLQGNFESDQEVIIFIKKLFSLNLPLSGLINNVGAFIPGVASRFSVSSAKEMFQLNFFAPCILIQKIIPIFLQDGGGHGGSILNIGSTGLIRSGADLYAPFYHASKQALWYLTKSFAKEFAPHHISVNMISPGKLDNSIDCSDASHVIPFGRFGTVDEISDMVSFLMKPESRYTTGQNIEISGGFCL